MGADSRSASTAATRGPSWYAWRGGRGVRADAERGLVHLGHVGRHQFAVADRPVGRPAHRLVGELLGPGAVEVGPVEDQLGGVRYRVPGEQPDEREEQLGSGAVAVVEDVKSHDPASRWRLLRPGPPVPLRTAGRTGRPRRRPPARRAGPRVKPDAFAAAKSASVTCAGLSATLPISASNGGERPSLLKARARCSADALPSPFRTRSTRARCAARFLSSSGTAPSASSAARLSALMYMTIGARPMRQPPETSRKDVPPPDLRAAGVLDWRGRTGTGGPAPVIPALVSFPWVTGPCGVGVGAGLGSGSLLVRT